VVAVSRSCGLRKPTADVMAEDALALVKKWSRERCGATGRGGVGRGGVPCESTFCCCCCCQGFETHI
jgi:hypothetical protein